MLKLSITEMRIFSVVLHQSCPYAVLVRACIRAHPVATVYCGGRRAATLCVVRADDKSLSKNLLFINPLQIQIYFFRSVAMLKKDEFNIQDRRIFACSKVYCSAYGSSSCATTAKK
jgi:hypothetical protein